MSDYDQWLMGGALIQCPVCKNFYQSLRECPTCVRVEQEREQSDAEEDSGRTSCPGTSSDANVLTE